MFFINFSSSTRFGNWLFQYAVAKSLAKGGPVAFYVSRDLSDSYVEALERRLEVLRGAQIVRTIPNGCCVLTTSDLCAGRISKDLDEESDYLLIGVSQLVRYFDEPLVKDLYRIPERIDVFIRKNYDEILSTSSLRVSIHVRRGDYLSLPHRHPFVGRSYLRRAVEAFPQDALFVVCSDDLPWCRSFFTEKMFPGRRFAFVEGGGVLSDLFMATYCHHNIMSNSTFSWWGAYLNPHSGKRVIVPSHWYGLSIGAEASAENIESIRFPGMEVLENDYECADRLKAVFLYCKSKLGECARKALGQ